MKKLILLLATCFILNGCGKNEEIDGGGTLGDRFTHAFVKSSGFVINDNYDRFIDLKFIGYEIEGVPNDEDSSKEYKELADKFGDTVTNKSYVWNMSATGPRWALSSPVTIDVYTTNKAFDENHGVNVSLNDIATVEYLSYKDLIIMYDHDRHFFFPEEYEKATKQMIITEFNETLPTFYRSSISIELPAPDQTGDYDFDVIVRMEDGKTVKESITKNLVGKND